MRRFWFGVLAVAVAVVSASAAGAFTVPPSSIDDGTEGEVRLLWTEPIDPADVGKTCQVVLVTTNIESTREGSDLIVESGGTTLVAQNVERDASSHTVVGQLTLGATITVSVQLGPEGMFSGGSDVETSCPPTGVPTPNVLPTPTVLPSIGSAPSAPGAVPAPAAAAVPAQPTFTG